MHLCRRPLVAVISLAAILAAMLSPGDVLAAEKPYDRVESAYARHMDPADPLAFPMKVRALSRDPYTFWRGSKDLFFHWAKEHCADWAADARATVICHGDLHLGNIGSYAAEGGWGKLAFGMVDFDDSARLPFQFELLQGLITLDLTASSREIALTDEDRARLAGALLDAYKTAVNSRRNATDLLAGEKAVQKLLAKGSKDYTRELENFTDAGRFRRSIKTGKGAVKEVLRPLPDARDDMAKALAQAAESSPELKALLAVSTERELRPRIRDVALRTRIGSSGSQGLRKILVLVEKPLKGRDHDVIFYLKEEIPAAAERSGIVPADPRPAGRRAAEDMDHLTDPAPYLNASATIAGRSYWVTFKEPWSDELSPDDVKTLDDLLAFARIWGTVAGATHREEGRFESITPRLNDALRTTLLERSAAYGKQLAAEFSDFRDDPRVKEKSAIAAKAIEAVAGE